MRVGVARLEAGVEEAQVGQRGGQVVLLRQLRQLRLRHAQRGGHLPQTSHSRLPLIFASPTPHVTK